MANAMGIHGIRVDRPSELATSPAVSVQQVAWFTLWATRSILNGDAGAVIDVARTTPRQIGLE